MTDISKLLIVCGPTATGKTGIATILARQFNGEIVSADSRHVYKYMDIGTGKDIPPDSKLKKVSRLKIHNKKFTIGCRLLKGVPVWLTDIVYPDYNFNLAEYVNLAKKVISDIRKRDKLPIIAGGTGLYIKALIEPLDDIFIPPDKKLRKRFKKLSPQRIAEKLQQVDPDKWQKLNESDRKNPRRLIRALEIARYYNQHRFSKKVHPLENKNSVSFDYLMVVLFAPYLYLSERIDRRVEKRIRQGVVKEMEFLLKKGYSSHLPSFSASPYRLFEQYKKSEKEKTDLSTLIKKWQILEHQLAKRQLTWFKKMITLYPKNKILTVDISEKKFNKKIEDKVHKWYTEKN